MKPDNLSGLDPIVSTKDTLSAVGVSITRPIKPRSPLVCCIGSIGKFGFSESVVATNQQINAVEFDLSTIDSKYGIYILAVTESQHISRSNLNVVPILNSHHQGNITVPIPPFDTQQRISNYLDEKTAKIDQLIKMKQALLDRLAEKRQALITQAVTKGLNPDVPMKPSGVDWLGDVPAHWEVKRLRFTANLISGSTPTTSNPEYWDGNIPWISPKDMKSDVIEDTIDHITQYAVEDYGLRLHTSDFPVIVIRGMILARKVPISIAKGPYTINQDMKVISTNELIGSQYLQLYLHSIESYLFTLIAEAGHGTKALRIDVFRDVPVLLPPKSEQVGIENYCLNQRANSDESSVKIQKSISLLKEYRSALITTAVTGQIADLNT